MSKVIRRGVFETNSSSSHSVSIRRGDIKNSYLTVNPDDSKIHVLFGEYGWGIDTLTSQSERLSYLCTMLIETEGRKVTSVDKIYETNGFKEINKAIADKCNCDGVCFDSQIQMKKSYDGSYYYLDFDGYIDHQSCEDYSNIDDFLKDYNTDILNFVFNDGVTVIIDNDNH